MLQFYYLFFFDGFKPPKLCQVPNRSRFVRTKKTKLPNLRCQIGWRNCPMTKLEVQSFHGRDDSGWCSTRGVLGWWPGCLASSIASMGFLMFPEFFGHRNQANVDIYHTWMVWVYGIFTLLGRSPYPLLRRYFLSRWFYLSILFPFGEICLFPGG